MELKFYKCAICGNIIAYAYSSGVPVECCGQEMEEMVPNTTDAASEKHVPVVSVEGNKVVVSVGSVEHPMTDKHYIEWICLQTATGNQRKQLTPDSAPRAEFYIAPGDKVEAALAYCNLHGLWKA